MQQLGKDAHPIIADYDADNYDYRSHWDNRAYEQWAESYAFKRLLTGIGKAQWLIDFGGGFGRNIVHYKRRAEHCVLVDYSIGNLQRAASTYGPEVESGQIFLIRADLYHLPFIDSAFDVGLIIRVLHHLTEVESAIKEMGRVVGHDWLLDVPIKHHVFARMRGLLHGEAAKLSTWEPIKVGNNDTPFVSFHLAMIRKLLTENGWDSKVVASVNNFRRWDQALPAWAVATLRPLVYGLEKVTQRVGKGWWGPSQFVHATRTSPIIPPASAMALPPGPEDMPIAALATKMVCPICHTPLQWSSDAAQCQNCSRQYLRTGLVWDFVPN